MVFPGRFSTGCLRCRQRKVKCDETKPSCRRCSIYGKACTGYSDQFHFRHTQRKASPETAPKTTALSPPAPEPLNSDRQLIRKRRRNETHQEAVQTSRWKSAIARTPDACYDDVSLYYFVRRFVSPPRADGFPGHFTFLPGLYDFHRHGLLETATLSVAQMAAYNQFGGEKFRLESYKNYGRAIRMIQDIIQSQDEATDDSVIASILLLCTLKDVSGDGLGDANEHAPGLFYLVERRGPMQIATSRGAELLFLALIRLQTHSFLHHDNNYSNPGAIATVRGVFDPIFRAMSMTSRTLLLRHSLSRCYTSLESQQDQGPVNTASDGSGTEHHNGVSVLAMCFETLEEFNSWDTEASEYWQSTFEGFRVPTTLGGVAMGATYYDAETACTVILIRSARLVLLMSMITYHAKLEAIGNGGRCTAAGYAALTESIPGLIQDVGKTIDDMLSSVPYALGDVDPYGQPLSVPCDGAGAVIIVHPIRLVATCAYATSSQRRGTLGVLKRINDSIGIRSAAGIGQNGICISRWAQEQVFLCSRALTAIDLASFPSLQRALDLVGVRFGPTS